MDVYSEISPLFRVSKFLGLAPFEVVEEVGNRRVVASKKYRAYGWAIATLFAVLKLYNHITFQRHSYTPHVTLKMTYLKNFSDVALVVLGVSLHVVNAHRVARFLRDLDVLDRRIVGVLGPNRISFERGRIFLTFQVTFLLAFVCGGVSTVLHMFYFSTGENSGFPFGISLYWFLSFSSFLINIMCATHFLAHVFLLRQRFVALKWKMEDLLHKETNGEKLAPKPGKLQPNNALCQTITSIRKIHFSLCDLAYEVNEIYSPLMLFFFASAFSGITILLNHCFEDLRRILHGENSPVVKEFIGFCLCLVAKVMVVISTIAGVCTSACHEANRVALPLHGLIANSKDPWVRTQAVRFSLQLLHRKLRFTAFGFFAIDATLLYAIVGGVTTYLIILIQFDLSLTPVHIGNPNK